jgi:lipopolysaccharide export system protein LptC
MPAGYASRAGDSSTDRTLNWRNISLGGLLLGAAVASWYWSRPPAEARPPATRVEPALGFYLTDAVLYGTGIDGELLYEVSAQRAEERPAEALLWLTQVKIDYRPAAQVDWSLTASTAVAPSDGAVLQLAGEVEVRSAATPDGKDTLIRTTALTLDTERRVVSSDEAVTVVLGTEQIEAVGIRAYLMDDRLELNSNVHAQFRP